jgi:PPOX class F420-dependent enzyme/OxyR family protein
MPDQPTSTPGPFTDAELAYLADQRLGRMATVQPDGTLQASPVGFTYNADAQAIDIGGRAMASSQKFRNVLANGRVAFVVDDIVSLDLWVVRCLEIRGTAQALADPPTPSPGSPARSSAFIRAGSSAGVSMHRDRVGAPAMSGSHQMLARLRPGNSP